ncbi:MAG: aminopeptidase P family protein [Hydrogenibacillus sp.]|nr:aminopeptidase P family protein [Hydrogenibacillus sp.]
MRERFIARRRALAAALRSHGAPALITDPVSIAYLTGIRLTPHERFLAFVLMPDLTAFWIVPELEAEAVRPSGIEAVAYRDGEDPFVRLVEGFSKVRVQTPRELFVEKRALALERAEAIAGVIPGVVYQDITPTLTRLRRTKDDAERAAHRRAAEAVDALIREIAAELRPGMTERDVAFRLEALARARGVAAMSFPTIVLSGARAALPHGEPGDVPIGGGILLIDLGVAVDGYHADITRTFFLGSPDDDFVRRYEAVLAAQQAAIDAVRPGVPYAELDRRAREMLERHGWAPYFTHRLGHGLGLDVHEPPSIHGDCADVIGVGEVFTVEPGIYLPGWGGIRIEDDVLVDVSGAVVLTRAPKAVEEMVIEWPRGNIFSE